MTRRRALLPRLRLLPVALWGFSGLGVGPVGAMNDPYEPLPPFSAGSDSDVPGLRGSREPRDADDSLEVSLLLLFFVVVLALGVLCSLYSICASVKCPMSHHGDDRGGSFQAMRSRSASYFREDLLDEEEILRLWICFYCDFANYEMKTHCALCGNDKREKELPQTPRSKAQSIRPASLFASMATTMSSSRSLSPSMLLAGSPHGSATTSALPMTPTPQESELPSTPPPLSPGSSSLTAMPPSPSGTPFAMLRRRKEWQPMLDTSGNVVWEHHHQPQPRYDDDNDDDPPQEQARIPESLVVETAFVSHNTISIAHPHGRLAFHAAIGAPVYGSTRPEYYNTDSDFPFLDPHAIEGIRQLSFPEKHRWFMQETTSILHVRWDNPTIRPPPGTRGDVLLVVPRDDLFHGSMRALLAVSQLQLHRPLRVRFLHEPGIDAGGIVREWFGLVLGAFLDEANGLFRPIKTASEGGSVAYAIHPSAGLAVPDHLLYFRAFGRLLGKALLEGHVLPVALSDVLLKHILSVPLSFADLAAEDPGLARSLRLLWETPLDDALGGHDPADPYALDFSVYHLAHGVVDLIPGGRDVAVTEANKREYVARLTRWHLGEAVADEVAALVSGLYDVLPIHLLAPFDYQELRLLLCGSPAVDLDDWERHTFVTGRKGRSSRIVQWFWRCLRSFTDAERCRLLQYATGAARVPVQGFKALTSNDGRLCPFTLNVLPRAECPFIRAYTCFNRLDLPLYRSEKELLEALRLVLLLDTSGFSIQ